LKGDENDPRATWSDRGTTSNINRKKIKLKPEVKEWLKAGEEKCSKCGGTFKSGVCIVCGFIPRTGKVRL
jgi:uncharacterized UBP type Zn finger protein